MENGEDIHEQLSAYLDGELSGTESDRVERDLGEDADLAAELEALRATRALLQGLDRRGAPRDFSAKVMQAVARSKAVGWTSSPRVRYLAAAAVVVIALGAGGIISLSLHNKMGQTQLARRDESLLEDKPQKLVEVARDLRVPSPPPAEEAFGVSTKAPPGPKAKPVKKVSRADQYLGFKAEDKGAALKKKTQKEKTTPKVGRARMGGIKADAEASPAGGGVAVVAGQDVAEVADVGRPSDNEIIYTENVKVEQKNIEKLLGANNIQIAPQKQRVLMANQAMNLNRSVAYNRRLNRAPQREDVEVQYIVLAGEEQLDRLRGQLQTAVRTNQSVSQLPEQSYRYALEARPEAPALRPATADKPKAQPMTSFARLEHDKLAEAASRPAGPTEDERVTTSFYRGAAKDEKSGSRQQDRPAGAVRTREKLQLQRRSRKPGVRAMLITLKYRRRVPLTTMQKDALKQAESLEAGRNRPRPTRPK